MSETLTTEEAARPLWLWNPLDYLRLLLNAFCRDEGQALSLRAQEYLLALMKQDEVTPDLNGGAVARL
jgi:hypothetical protein